MRTAPLDFGTQLQRRASGAQWRILAAPLLKLAPYGGGLWRSAPLPPLPSGAAAANSPPPPHGGNRATSAIQFKSEIKNVE